MLDVYYGYDDNGLVRTNLAGGVDRATLEKERGKDAVRALDRMGALTGTADTSGEKQDLYFCHDFCELGAVPVADVFAEIKDFLDRNLTEVVILDFEDYVKPKDLRAALDDAGLGPRLAKLDRDTPSTTTMLDLVKPKREKDDQKQRRLIPLSEKHGDANTWLDSTYDLYQETPFTFPEIKNFTCGPKRGTADNPLFLINHWLRPDGPPDPAKAGTVNSRQTLTERFQKCVNRRMILPNAIAVDFTEIGDLNKTVNRINAAIASVTGASESVNKVIDFHVDSGELTDAQLAEIRGIRRLPKISKADAVKLLGPLTTQLLPAVGVPAFEQFNGLRDAGDATDPSTTTTTTP